MKKIYLSLIATLFLFGSNVYSQVAGYSFVSSAGSYSRISGGTAIKYGTVLTSSSTTSATLDDDRYYDRPIGFNFVFNGVEYSTVAISSNGWLRFASGTTTTNSYTPISSTDVNNSNVVAASAADLYGALSVSGSVTTGASTLTGVAGSVLTDINVGDSVTGTGISGRGAAVTAVTANSITIDKTSTITSTTALWRVRNGEVRYETIGTLPNRTFVVQYTNFSRFSGYGDRMNFQIRLSETSNRVQVVYGTYSTNNVGTALLQVGLKGITNADFNNRTTTGDWSTSSAGTLNTATNSFTTTSFPAIGLTYTWTVPSCFTPTIFTTSAATTTGITIGWNAVIGVSNYQYEVRTSGAAGSGATGLVTSGNSATNSVVLTGLTGGSGYTIYVRSACSGTLFSAWSLAFGFETNCDAAIAGTVPYFQNFDVVTAPALPTCIVVENITAGSPTWVNTAATFTGSTPNNVMKYTYNSTIAADDWFFIKGLTLTSGVRYSISFKYAGASYPEKLEVRVGNAATSTAALAGPQVFLNETISAVGDGSGVFTPTTTGVYYFGFHVFSLADQNTLSIDNISVIESPNAPNCTTNISPANGATNVIPPPVLTWNAANGATSYDVYLGTAPGTFTNIGNIAGTTATITGTTANTTYYWYVAPKNAGGSATGCESTAFSFTTTSGPANDSCGAAITITPNVPLNSTTVYSSLSLPAAACDGFTSSGPTGDVWFKFNTVAGGDATLAVTNAAGSFDPIIIVYSGTPAAGCTGLTSVKCADLGGTGAGETVSLTGLTANTTYYARVYGYVLANANTFTITITGAALPVTIADFHGERNGGVHNLVWTTQTESNNNGFELQRSADGVNFNVLEFVATQAQGGTSSSALDYRFTDNSPMVGNNYYRLNQIDKDGRSNLSKTVLLKGAKATKIELVSLYPNPATDALNVSMEAPASARVELVVMDIAGKVVMKEYQQLAAGANRFTLNVSKLGSGSYLIKAICADDCVTAVSKFVKQ